VLEFILGFWLLDYPAFSWGAWFSWIHFFEFVYLLLQNRHFLSQGAVLLLIFPVGLSRSQRLFLYELFSICPNTKLIKQLLFIVIKVKYFSKPVLIETAIILLLSQRRPVIEWRSAILKRFTKLISKFMGFFSITILAWLSHIAISIFVGGWRKIGFSSALRIGLELRRNLLDYPLLIFHILAELLLLLDVSFARSVVVIFLSLSRSRVSFLAAA